MTTPTDALACNWASSAGAMLSVTRISPATPCSVGVALVQGGMDAADHLVDVVDAAAQVGIVHAIEHLGDAVALQAQRVVGGVAAGADQLVQALQQFGVVQQQGVQVEEFADFLCQRAMQALAQDVHLRRARRPWRRACAAVRRRRRRAMRCFVDFQRVRQAHPGATQRAAARGAGRPEQQTCRASAVLVEAAFEQGGDRVGGGGFVLAIDAQRHRGALAGGQQHHAHDALGIDLAALGASVASQRKPDSNCTSLAVARACRPRRFSMMEFAFDHVGFRHLSRQDHAVACTCGGDGGQFVECQARDSSSPAATSAG